MLKSAQFPFHAWLPEVMETPTPVSALLHAGIINAGGFLLVRFADILLLTPPAMHTLAVVGLVTAVFGGLVMLTCPSVKGALAYSTVAQMGLMVFECGVGAFSLAMLHLVAHSLYKAHAFLAAGSAVDVARTARLVDTRVTPGRVWLRAGVFLALTVPAITILALRVPDPLTATALAVLAIGLSQGVALSVSQVAVPRALLSMMGFALILTGAYVAQKLGTQHWLQGVVAAEPAHAASSWLLGLAVATFALTALLQLLFPLLAHHPAMRAAYVHLKHGLYVDVLFDRLVGAFARRSADPAPLGLKEWQ